MAEYDVFISYSNAADKRLAPALQRGLQRFAKPFYRRQALRVFRDKTGLAVNESLWVSITGALDASRHFLLLASPDSATSHWVRREVAHWLAKSSGRRLLILLTDGEIVWDDTANDFDWNHTTALPKELSGVFQEEPLWLDLRWARTEEHLSLRHPRFRDGIADLAATLHGIPKDRIAGRDIQEHRRTLAAAWSAVTALIVLTIVAVLAAYVAHRNEQQALSRLLAAQSLNVLEERSFDLALLLAVEALEKTDTYEARDALMTTVQRQPNLVGLLHGAGKVRYLAFSPDGEILASVSSDRAIRLWDVFTRSLRGEPLIAGERVPKQLVFSPDGRTLAAVTSGGTILWDLSSDPPVARAVDDGPPDFVVTSDIDPKPGVHSFLDQLEPNPQRRTALGPEGKILATTEIDAAQLWSVDSGERLGPPLSAQSPYVRALAFNPQEPLLATGSTDGTIALWNFSNTPLLSKRLEAHELSVNRLAFDPDGKLLASVGYSGEIILWEVPEGRRLAGPTSAADGGIRALRFSPDGASLLAHGSEIVRWTVPSLEHRKPLPHQIPQGSASAIAPHLTSLAVGKNSGEIVLWDLEQGEPLWASSEGHDNRLFALTFSPDGKLLVSAGNDRIIVLWDVSTGELLGTPLEGHIRPVSDLEFSDDGRRLASYDSHGTLIVWDVSGRHMVGKPLQRENAYAATSAMVLSPDGQMAATSGDEGFVRLWDVATWRPLGAPLKGHSDYVLDMTFRPDGAYLATGGLGGDIILWNLRAQAWADHACRMANRNLTPREKVIYLSLEPDDDYPSACYYRSSAGN